MAHTTEVVGAEWSAAAPSGQGTVENAPRRLNHLRALEAESIHILREAVAEFARPVMLYSIGKDSSVMLRLAQKAFSPGKIPFPLLHIDTSYKFPEMIEFRDAYMREIGAQLIVHKNQEALDAGPYLDHFHGSDPSDKFEGLIDPFQYGRAHAHRRQLRCRCCGQRGLLEFPKQKPAEPGEGNKHRRKHPSPVRSSNSHRCASLTTEHRTSRRHRRPMTSFPRRGTKRLVTNTTTNTIGTVLVGRSNG